LPDGEKEMRNGSSTDASSLLLPIRYRIEWNWQGSASREVSGFAFEIPGWPEFHCCVRWGNRMHEESLFNDWLIDHYESGLAVMEAGRLERKEDAPETMRKLLDSKGKDRIHKVLRAYGAL
jgi:hypothetical protein